MADKETKSVTGEKISSEPLAGTHRMTPEQLYQLLNVNPNKGLTTTEVNKRREVFGPNVLPKITVLPQYVYFLVDLLTGKQFYFWVGAFCMLIMAAFGFLDNGYRLGIGTIIVATVSGIFRYYSRWSDQRSREKFELMMPGKSLVLRNGTWGTIDGKELVPGDIVEVNYNNIFVPADVRVLENYGCKVNNFYLTESQEPQILTEEVSRSATSGLHCENLSFLGGIVTEGRFRGIVVRRIAPSQN